MSISTIKSDLENHIKIELTSVPIKWNNTNIYTLNNIQLTQSQIDTLNFFIEPKVIPIANDRELMSTNKPFQTELFFQINIYNKINTGTGAVYSTIENLDVIFREKYIGDTLCDATNTIGSFIDGEFEITPYRVHCTLWN